MPMPTILIVDEEPAVRALVKLLLGTRRGYTALEAGTASGALKAARERGPDLVLLEAALPDRDGFSVCRSLKADPRTRSVPVVMLTTKGCESDRARAADAGADAFVAKPFSPRGLLRLLDQAIATRSAA